MDSWPISLIAQSRKNDQGQQWERLKHPWTVWWSSAIVRKENRRNGGEMTPLQPSLRPWPSPSPSQMPTISTWVPWWGRTCGPIRPWRLLDMDHQCLGGMSLKPKKTASETWDVVKKGESTWINHVTGKTRGLNHHKVMNHARENWPWTPRKGKKKGTHPQDSEVLPTISAGKLYFSAKSAVYIHI